MLIETGKYRCEQDIVGRFVDDQCVESEHAAAMAKDLYGRFQAWCKQTGEYAMTQRRFGEALTERGYEREKSNGTRYKGIGLLTTGF